LLNPACVSCGTRPGAVRWALTVTRKSAYQSQVPDSYAESTGILFGISQLNILTPDFAAGPCLSIPAPLVEQVKVNPLRGKLLRSSPRLEGVAYLGPLVNATTDHVSHSGNHPTRATPQRTYRHVLT